MSGKASLWAWKQHVATPTEQHVLLAIANRLNDEGRTWVSQATLAKDTKLSERSVRSMMGRLELGGFIHRKKQGSAARGRTTDLITLPLGTEHVVPPAIYRQDLPLNDLPAKNVVFTGRICRGTLQEPLPIQDRTLGRTTALPPTRSTHATAYRAAKDGQAWDEDHPFGRGA